MIPKIIHYAWFGSEIPSYIDTRINEWKKVLPEWRFILWNENNFDINRYAFTRQMYKEKKLGYAADELRFDVLYRYGGFYLDVDMLLKKDLTSLLNNKMVWGFQYDNSILTSMIGSEPNQELLSYILDVYEGRRYPELQEQSFLMTSNPFITKILMREYTSFRTNGKYQKISPGIVVYPKDYFTYPSKDKVGNFAEHLFDNSWGSGNQGFYGSFKSRFKHYLPYTWARISASRGVKSAEKDGVPLQK